MKHELFVEQPNIELHEGIMIDASTELEFKNENVEQHLGNLKLETILEQEGCHNGINTFKNKSYICLNLVEGQILVFDEARGYYLPTYPLTRVEDALVDIESLKELPLTIEREEK